MIVKSRAWFILPLLLALAPLRLQAADATNAPATTPAFDDAVNALAGAVSPATPDDPAAVSGTYTPDPADTSDWSEGHTLYTNTPPNAPLPKPSFKKVLLKMAARLVEVQQKTPDPKIQTIIDNCHLGDTAALAALPPTESRQAMVRVAVSLYQASKSDPLAVQLMKEFEISYTPAPAKASAPAPAPAAPPSTNAPPAAAT